MTVSMEEMELASAFSSFVNTAKGLEKEYAGLRRKAERLDFELHEVNKRLSAILSALPAGVVAAGPNGRIVMINRMAKELLNIPSTGTEIRFSVSDFKDEMGKALLLPTDGIEDRETGSSVMRIRHLPIPDNGGHLWILEDRTELERLESKVAHLDRLAALGRMALSIAHEIRNPLNGVAGFAGLLRRRDLGEKEKRYSEAIIEGVRRVEGIIKNLLAFARPSDLVLRKIDLCRIVEQVLTEWNLPGLVVKLSPSPALIAGDSTAVGQVLANLLSNAVDAGGANFLVELELRAGSWVLALEDDGPGLPVEERTLVFEPFHSTKAKGTGLGLSIVHRIMELHGGTVRVVDPVDLNGARFETFWPVGEEQ